MSPRQKTWLSALAILALLSLLPAIWFERHAPHVWRAPLLEPFFVEQEPDRHTPRVTEGQYLPPQITRDTTLGPAAGPVLVTHNTLIESGVTLRIEPGTQLLFHEFAAVTIAGALELRGTTTAPITLISNELHPANQQWGGLMFLPNSRGDVTYTTIEQAIPAVSCYPVSEVRVDHSTLRATAIGAVVYTPQCVITNSRIGATDIGMLAIDTEPNLVGTVTTAGTADIKRVSADTALPTKSQ